MTKKERYLSVLDHKKADRLTWAPNFDHWYTDNTKRGTIPEQYANLSGDDLIRAVEGTIWRRCSIIKPVNHESVVEQTEISNDGTEVKVSYKTPVGTVYTIKKDNGETKYLTSHLIKTAEDIDAVKYMVENTVFSYDDKKFTETLSSVGEDGICLTSIPWCLPFIQFGKTDAGWENGIYLYFDHTQKVEDLLEAYTKKNCEAAELLAASPAHLIYSGDNMDQLTCTPTFFEIYAIDYYKNISKIFHGGGKNFQVHWCGRTNKLIKYLPECGIDVVEAVTIKPMDNITIPEILDIVGDTVTVQGGVPSVMMTPQCASKEELQSYIKDLLQKVPHGYRFVLGMSDNIPPDSDFSRVKMISDMVNAL